MRSTPALVGYVLLLVHLHTWQDTVVACYNSLFEMSPRKLTGNPFIDTELLLGALQVAPGHSGTKSLTLVVYLYRPRH